MRRDRQAITVFVKGIPDRVTSAHVARAPTLAGQMDSTTMLHGLQETIVPLDHEDTGVQFVWEHFVGWDRDTDGELWLLVRWWGYAPHEEYLKP